MKLAFVTGITGHDGPYLAELLVSKGNEVFGLIRGQNNSKWDLFERTVPGVKLLTGDLTDFSSLMRALEAAQPEEVYNLGAISHVAYSWENAQMTSDVTGKGVLNILEAIRVWAGPNADKGRFYQVSASEMFGKVQDVPQRESTLLWPRSPYGVSKVFGHYMTINYRESYGMHASCGILFNHESPPPWSRIRYPEGLPGRRPDQVGCAGLDRHGQPRRQARLGFCRRLRGCHVAHAPAGRRRRLCGGNGETHSIKELVDIAFNEVGIDDWADLVTQDPRFMRPAEVDLLIGDAAKAKEKLGWEPTVGFDELVRMMVRNDLAEQTALARR